ncbi:sigma-70 family RNA polymerase sigma factor (plasmid) [Streptomyces sp. NBC_00853]|uniref:RNA polymerase sigma factor n=1 Tax=Streptomyces sp. NBC_00853 TaxID=2903681 RepID=UPI002F90BBB3|nr:sigma-70 family RNA polymerase sigma factor [Streptomyces sp. NBC_00853]
MTLTSDFPCARTGCEQGAEVSCVTCPYGPTMMEVKPPSTPALESLSPTILSAELSAFHDSHRLNFVMYARGRGAQREEAEDVVNTAFLTLYRAGEAFLAADNRDGFAFKVLRDTIADHFRRRSRRPHTQALPEEPGDCGGTDGGSGDIDSVICRVDIERALQALPPRQADCLRLQLLLELSREQIAHYLGISPSAVSSHLSTGRRALAEHLEGYQPCTTTGRGGRG